MKKRNLILTILLVVCLVLFGLFWAYNRIRTDNKPPQITVEQPDVIPEISVQDPQDTMLQGISAWDERDGDVTDQIIVEKITKLDASGQVRVSYAAFDRSGNVAKAQRTFRYTDYEGPRFSLTEALIYTKGITYDVLDRVQAHDLRDGDIRHRIKTTMMSTAPLSEEGNHEIQFRVTNSLGDTESLILPVEVVAAGRYSGQVQLTEYLVYLPVGATFRAEDYLQMFTYGAQKISLENGMPKELTLRTQGAVDTQTPGIYTVSYAVAYATGSNVQGYSKLIVVVEG